MQKLSNRTAGFTDSVIRRMTRVSLEFGAINLSQGFPDFDPPRPILDRLAEVAAQGPHQYSVTWGAQNFREALAAKQSRLDLQTGVHIFRHTLLTAIDHDGGSALARDVGGHKSVQITNQYMHPSMDERLEAVNATPYAALLVGSGGK